MANSNANSDTTLLLNSTNLTEACSSWKSKVSGVGLSNIDVSSKFSALIDFGIGANYFSSLKTALERADKLATNISKLIDMVATDQEEIDNKSAEEATENTYGNANYDRKKSSGGGSSSSGRAAVAALAATSAGDYTPDNTDKDITIKSENETDKKELDTSEQEEVEVALGSILNENTSTNINVPEESVIKTTILESQYISEDLKEIIAEMDENEIKTELSNILKGSLASDFSKTIIKIFDNDLKEHFKNATVYDSADSISKIYDFISRDNNFQQELKELYLGVSEIEAVDLNSIMLTRSFVDSLAATNNVSYEDILNDSKYQPILLEGIENLKESFYLLSLSKEMENKITTKTYTKSSVSA